VLAHELARYYCHHLWSTGQADIPLHVYKGKGFIALLCDAECGYEQSSWNAVRSWDDVSALVIGEALLTLAKIRLKKTYMVPFWLSWRLIYWAQMLFCLCMHSTGTASRNDLSKKVLLYYYTSMFVQPDPSNNTDRCCTVHRWSAAQPNKSWIKQ
jgi:hypothetical protein